MAVEIPAGFPRDFLPGSVPGVQPNLLVRRIGEKYLSGTTGDECRQRYEICADLAQQLISYYTQKRAAKPEWSLVELLQSTNEGIRSKHWDISEAEIIWTMKQVAQELHRTQPHQ